MKTIGLLGGMSWESTAIYYRLINQGIKKALGNLHSGKIILNSVDFDPIELLLTNNDWQAIAEILIKAAHKIEGAGADCLLICTNTMHKVAPEIEQDIDIPLLHIADATAEALVLDGVSTVGLLGTAFTMEENFYKGRLSIQYGLDVIVPEKQDRTLVHDVIFNELCLGKIEDTSRQEYIRIIGELEANGAQAVILGCTEIGSLIKQQDITIPMYDTTVIHAAKAVEWALAED